ncbi:MAG: 4Fe-4S dicluster domain-containing protein [Candidatus Thermoplasmatota archaeon]|nr:4Fe-4S dicluster domain-containing protein [Candidatus Thermoplasmatota archaeon]|tara:strand:+ start:1687 stop:3099 length:1413 start_codon:yes stop_codon:yes gene_type:complete
MANYGFVIDNRTCIGCHACTVACKSEHDVPIGVNRTHVKYIEKGSYPDSTREFSVHRCNHCEDAPCTTICPTTALFTRADGIVDFDDERCIGCKSCMQACPYDALYIDPNKGTAAKCNYCAHRVENSYEPACVIVCPTESIVSGDLDDPSSKISEIVSTQNTTVRKPESGTIPNVYYIEASEEMLDPAATDVTGYGMWTDQAFGVGHFAKYAESRLGEADTQSMIVQLALEKKARKSAPRDQAIIRDVMERLADESGSAKRSYDQPSKGVLWGWEVSAYIWTKGIASGTYVVAVLAMLSGMVEMSDDLWAMTLGVGIAFLALTGLLLVIDLDRPDRFLYVILRPNWDSWLVKGAYVLSGYGGILALSIGVLLLDLDRSFIVYLAIAGVPLALLTGVYTAWLLGQAKGRSWSEDTLLPAKFLIETLLIGAAVFFPMALMDPLAILVGTVILTGILVHDNRLVVKPQMEPLL